MTTTKRRLVNVHQSGRKLVCGDKGPRSAWLVREIIAPRRAPRCNRVVGHLPPHREYDRSDAEVRAEWGSGVPEEARRSPP